jgi:hypothetical protein
MTNDIHAAVLRALRDGCDPRTGASLDAGHLCQRPEVIRALFAAVEAIERGGGDDGGIDGGGDSPEPAPIRPARPRPPNSGQPWNDDDDRRLVEAFDGGADERELADAFGRSRSSIRARLIRLGRGALLGDGPAPRYPVAEPLEPAGVVAASGDSS